MDARNNTIARGGKYQFKIGLGSTLLKS